MPCTIRAQAECPTPHSAPPAPWLRPRSHLQHRWSLLAVTIQYKSACTWWKVWLVSKEELTGGRRVYSHDDRRLNPRVFPWDIFWFSLHNFFWLSPVVRVSIKIRNEQFDEVCWISLAFKPQFWLHITFFNPDQKNWIKYILETDVGNLCTDTFQIPYSKIKRLSVP